MNAWREGIETGRWSIGAAVAWQVAATEAMRGGHDAVEPLHVFIGICSLENVLLGEIQRDFGISKNAASSLRAECDALSLIFAKLRIDQANLRRAARAEIGTGSHTV